MTIPLPPDCSTQLSGAGLVFSGKESESIHIGDRFLDAEERYEIHIVKAAERPHLLHYTPPHLSSKCSDEDSDNAKETKCIERDDHLLPLIDGCDIPGWRKEAFVHVSATSELQSRLNIGASSTLFRRERQWPVSPCYREQYRPCNDERKLKLSFQSRSTSKWERIRRRLTESQPCEERRAIEVDHETCSSTFDISDEYGCTRTVTTFAVEYEQKNIPVKIIGATNDWSAMPVYDDDRGNHFYESFNGGGRGGWTFQNLLQRFGDVYWRFSDTHGAMMTMSTYAKYISNVEGTCDDSPLGIYDAEFGDHDSPTFQLTKEYHPPACFSNDLFSLALDDDLQGEGHRPPWRWILIGPGRSGTGLHIDPLWTNAWVTVLQGRKRWILFPPSTPKGAIGMDDDLPQIPSVVWFDMYYDKVTSHDWPEEWRPVEVVQEVGETVFVPNGWPHLVLNLELTVAVTHNYASEFGPFERMWKEVVSDEPAFAIRWFRGLKQKRLDLAKRLVDYHMEAVKAQEDWATRFQHQILHHEEC